MRFVEQFDAECDPHMLIAHPMAQVNELRNTAQVPLGLACNVRGHFKEWQLTRVGRSAVQVGDETRAGLAGQTHLIPAP